MANKHTINTLKRLFAKYGDVPLSEAIRRETDRRGGRPRSWDTDKLIDLYLDVEAAKARGMGQRQACIAIARFRGLKSKSVEKRHAEGRECFPRPAQPYIKEILKDHLHGDEQWRLPGRPDLTKFLRTYKGAAKTPRI